MLLINQNKSLTGKKIFNILGRLKKSSNKDFAPQIKGYTRHVRGMSLNSRMLMQIRSNDQLLFWYNASWFLTNTDLSLLSFQLKSFLLHCKITLASSSLKPLCTQRFLRFIPSRRSIRERTWNKRNENRIKTIFSIGWSLGVRGIAV